MNGELMVETLEIIRVRDERPLDAEELSVRTQRESVKEKKWLTGGWLQDLAPWDTMFMLDFKAKKDFVKADVIFEKWWKRNCSGIPTFYAIEEHPGGHGSHLHGLMVLKARGLLRKPFWESWWKQYGFCAFREPRSVSECVSYCSGQAVQECIKDGQYGLLGVSMDQRKVNRAIMRNGFRVRIETSAQGLFNQKFFARYGQSGGNTGSAVPVESQRTGTAGKN